MGMTVDAAGDLWVAIYGGGCIHRYAHDGVLRQSIPVPAAQVTSCAPRRPGAAPALRHHGDGELDVRAAARRAVRRPRVLWTPMRWADRPPCFDPTRSGGRRRRGEPFVVER